MYNLWMWPFPIRAHYSLYLSQSYSKTLLSICINADIDVQSNIITFSWI